ncbi:usherin-like [Patella vulgata]|uniref:usherin-like n=1 Tax=Patella vulgata TaxID=6465 RepID=UPI0024A8D309|nr:usherin-like [Patella vulgata]
MLFFTYGGTGIYMYAGVVNGTLYFEFSNGVSKGSATYNNPDSVFCDGNWRSVYLRKKGLQANLTIEGVGTVLNGDPDTVFTVPTASEIFVGGIPKKSEVLLFMENSAPNLPRESFGGCIALFAVDGNRYDFGKDATQVVNVNMDGCAPFQVPNNTCQDRLITEVYNGYDTQTFDTGLQPYTDYIYRVTASNSVGLGSGPWAYGRTKEGAPTGVKEPFNVEALSGYMIQAEWNKPASTSGLLSKFILVGYVNENDTIAPIQTEFLDTDSRAGNLTNAVPYTSYIIKLSACTAGGCTESEDGVPVMTLSEAPEEVPSLTAIPSTTSLAISWNEPGKPNGPLSGYYLYQDNVQIYQGGERFYQLNNLQFAKN